CRFCLCCAGGTGGTAAGGQMPVRVWLLCRKLLPDHGPKVLAGGCAGSPGMESCAVFCSVHSAPGGLGGMAARRRRWHYPDVPVSVCGSPGVGGSVSLLAPAPPGPFGGSVGGGRLLRNT